MMVLFLRIGIKIKYSIKKGNSAKLCSMHLFSRCTLFIVFRALVRGQVSVTFASSNKPMRAKILIQRHTNQYLLGLI